MEAQQNFRSAFNGFNREDVVRYIEYLNSKHAAEITQLNSEIQFLSSRPAETPAQEPASEETAPLAEQIEAQTARIQEISDRCAALEEELSAAKAEKEQLSEKLSAVTAEKEALNAELNTLRQEDATRQARIASELEAYRRAERMERMAIERADQLCQQVNGVLADTTVKVDNAANLVSDLSERVMGQLMELQTAVAGSKQILRDATATLYTIRPSAENE